MSTTANFAIDNTAWVLLFTAGASTTKCGMQVFGKGNMLVQVGGSNPGSGDVSEVGRVKVPGYHGGFLDLTLDNGDTVYGRFDRAPAGSGARVTVLG